MPELAPDEQPDQTGQLQTDQSEHPAAQQPVAQPASQPDHAEPTEQPDEEDEPQAGSPS